MPSTITWNSPDDPPPPDPRQPENSESVQILLAIDHGTWQEVIPGKYWHPIPNSFKNRMEGHYWSLQYMTDCEPTAWAYMPEYPNIQCWVEIKDGEITYTKAKKTDA